MTSGTPADPNSFANNTMRVRIPKIALDTRLDNEDWLDAAQADALTRLSEDVASGNPVQPIQGPPSSTEWDEIIGRSWLEIPWFLAETAFYRHILQATDYFVNNRDPFAVSKKKDLSAEKSWQLCDTALADVDPSPYVEEEEEECVYAPGSPSGKQGHDLVAAKKARQGLTMKAPVDAPDGVVLQRALQYALWGNRADGCYKQVKNTAGTNTVESDQVVQTSKI